MWMHTAGNRKQETGNRKQETGVRIQGCLRKEALFP
jgi:hypothetical protein